MDESFLRVSSSSPRLINDPIRAGFRAFQENRELIQLAIFIGRPALITLLIVTAGIFGNWIAGFSGMWVSVAIVSLSILGWKINQERQSKSANVETAHTAR